MQENRPGWRNAPEMLLPLALLYGGFSGLFLGRALALMKLTREWRVGIVELLC